MFDFTPPVGLFEAVSDKANCTISFEDESGVTVDANGFAVISSNTVNLSARVYRESNTSGRNYTARDVFPPGSNLEGELFRGRLSDPKTFPGGLKDLDTVRVTLTDGRTGTGMIKIKTSNPLVPNAALGQRFNLLFRQD